jgi:hypothetical protein
VKNILLGDPLIGVATPWYSDGTFNNPNWGICAEFPADYTDLSGKHADGVGYLETVGFESVEAYRKFALGYLRSPADWIDAAATAASSAPSRPAHAGAPAFP